MRSIAPAIASGDAVHNSAFTPAFTTRSSSGSQLMKGRPACAASCSTSPWVSVRDGKQNTSAAA